MSIDTNESLKSETFSSGIISETEGNFYLDPKIKTYGLLESQNETESFLLANPDLIDAQTVHQLLEWGSVIKNDSQNFNKVIRQCVYIIYLYDLCRTVNIEPVQCVSYFFDQIKHPNYVGRFQKEVQAYQVKVKTRSYEEMLKEVVIMSSEQECQESSTSSSEEDLTVLDPLQVYASLPLQLQQCLNDEDLVALDHELSLLTHKKAKDFFSRMLRSGLLLPLDEGTALSDSDSKSSSSFEDEITELLGKIDLRPHSHHHDDSMNLCESSSEWTEIESRM